jgi:hypothetical protein
MRGRDPEEWIPVFRKDPALDRSEFLERYADKYPITIPGAFKAPPRTL